MGFHAILDPWENLDAKMWTSGVNWDDKLDEVLEGKEYKWLEELPNLPSVTVPRCLKLSKEEVVSSALHIFIDASLAAYGATAYARYICQSGSISRRIIASKARVAPLKAVSLPRLEMMGAIVGLCLASSTASSAGTTWLSILSILILCISACQISKSRQKIRGVGSNKHNKSIL